MPIILRSERQASIERSPRRRARREFRSGVTVAPITGPTAFFSRAGVAGAPNATDAATAAKNSAPVFSLQSPVPIGLAALLRLTWDSPKLQGFQPNGSGCRESFSEVPNLIAGRRSPGYRTLRRNPTLRLRKTTLGSRLHVQSLG